MIRAGRVLLRDWREDDLEPFAALNADPVVMAHFPSTLTREQSDAYVAREHAAIAAQGYGPAALGQACPSYQGSSASPP